MSENIKQKVLSNLFWRFFERCGAKGVTLIVTIVLARLLEPSVYGILAIVTVVTTFLQVFVDSGLGNALIQKKDADDIDFSSVFYFNIVICLILYTFICLGAPYFADFYNMPELNNILKFVGITVIISGLKNIQQAYVSRNFIFKRFFYSTLGGTIIAAIVGVSMAYNGFGVWALATQFVVNNAIDTIILWFTVKWRPKMLFSWKRLKSLLNYGCNLLISALLDTFYKDLRQLIIGKLYTTSDLAFYNQGDKIPKVIVSNINGSIDSVLMPTMSKLQDDSEKVKNATRRAIKISTYVMMPMMTFLAVSAESLVVLVFSEKWLPCVIFLRIVCFTNAFYVIHSANLNAIKAVGRSDIFLKLEIIKKVVGLIILLSSMWYGVMAIAYSSIIESLLSQIINAWPNKKLLKYSYLEQLKDMIPNMILTTIFGLFIYSITFLKLNIIITLIIQFIFGSIFYIICSKILKNDNYDYVCGLVTSFLKNSEK